MTQTYPVTRNNTVRLSPSYTLSVQNGSKTPQGQCILPVVSVLTTKMTLANSVTLGKSPSNYKNLIRLGSNAGSPLSGRLYSVRGGTGYWNWYGTNPTGTYNACFTGAGSGFVGRSYGGFPAIDISLNSYADSVARAQLLGRYLDVKKKFRGGNFIAECRETIRAMKHPVDSLYKGFHKFIRGVNSIKGLNSQRAYAARLGDAWLGWSFGWKPLFDDVRSAAEALANLQTSGRFDGKVINGFGSLESGECYNPVTGFSWLMHNRIDKSRSEVAYRALIKTRPSSFSSFADNFGVSATDIIPAVWEAVPWSFLVDYFVNVNEILEAAQWCHGDVGWVMKRILNTRSTTYSYTIRDALPAGLVVNNGLAPTVYSAIYKGRSPSGIPYPTWRFKLPSLGQGFNIAALWASIKSSKPRFVISHG